MILTQPSLSVSNSLTIFISGSLAVIYKRPFLFVCLLLLCVWSGWDNVRKFGNARFHCLPKLGQAKTAAHSFRRSFTNGRFMTGKCSCLNSPPPVCLFVTVEPYDGVNPTQYMLCEVRISCTVSYRFVQVQHNAPAGNCLSHTDTD